MIKAVEKYKIAIYSIACGLFYFVFSISAEYGDGGKQAFVILMLFLPGVTFPIGTSYFNLSRLKNVELRIFFHFMLSVMLYHGTVWVSSLERKIDSIIVMDGFVGSLFYLIITMIIMSVRMKTLEILLISIISGLAFLPFAFIDNSITNCGIGVFIWTIANGVYLNYCKNRMLLTSPTLNAD